MADYMIVDSEDYEPTSEYAFATVYAVGTDGLQLTFDGAATHSKKYYKCNTCVPFAVGDRVKIIKDSGTYVVEYVVGAPKAGITSITSISTLSTSATLSTVITKVNTIILTISGKNVLK